MTERYQSLPTNIARLSEGKKRLIKSPHNAHFKRWMSLFEPKGMRKFLQCLVFGKKLIRETINRHPSICLEYLTPPKTQELLELPNHVTPYQLSSELFQRIDSIGTSSPILVCQTHRISSINLTTPPDGLEVLCPLGDPSNIGTIARSCRAFGVQKLILLKEAAYPFHPKAIRASSGTIFEQPMFDGPGIQDLTDSQYSRWITSLDLHGESLLTWQGAQHIRLLVGEEGLGLPNGRFQHTLAIPQVQGVDSLNAAIAASIALFSYRQRFPL